jgi:hypothetical protein
MRDYAVTDLRMLHKFRCSIFTEFIFVFLLPLTYPKKCACYTEEKGKEKKVRMRDIISKSICHSKNEGRQREIYRHGSTIGINSLQEKTMGVRPQKQEVRGTELRSVTKMKQEANSK